jgi:hypothetical protein
LGICVAALRKEYTRHGFISTHRGAGPYAKKEIALLENFCRAGGHPDEKMRAFSANCADAPIF